MKRSIPLMRDVFRQAIAVIEEWKHLRSSLSDEQMKAVHEFVTARYLAGYALGYEDAKRGNPNIVEMLAARTPQEQEELPLTEEASWMFRRDRNGGGLRDLS